MAMWIELALGTPVVLWCGWPFLKRGWMSLVKWKLNMFSLIAMGVMSAWTFSVAGVIAPQIFPDGFRDEHGYVGLYFEAAAVIVTLVLLGQVMELRARGGAGRAIRALLDLAAKTARVIRPDGTEAEVPPHLWRQEVKNLFPDLAKGTTLWARTPGSCTMSSRAELRCAIVPAPELPSMLGMGRRGCNSPGNGLRGKRSGG